MQEYTSECKMRVKFAGLKSVLAAILVIFVAFLVLMIVLNLLIIILPLIFLFVLIMIIIGALSRKKKGRYLEIKLR
jgi:Flp pilus assembly protein TadB